MRKYAGCCDCRSGSCHKAGRQAGRLAGRGGISVVGTGVPASSVCLPVIRKKSAECWESRVDTRPKVCAHLCFFRLDLKLSWSALVRQNKPRHLATTHTHATHFPIAYSHTVSRHYTPLESTASVSVSVIVIISSSTARRMASSTSNRQEDSTVTTTIEERDGRGAQAVHNAGFWPALWLGLWLSLDISLSVL